MKMILWIIGILIIVAGAWYVWNQSQTGAAPSGSSYSQETSPSSQSSSGEDQGTAISGPSDADLQADLDSIDTQMSAASESSASASSFNDTPVAQTE